MLHTNNPIIKHKAGLLNLAEELGNVSRACKVMGVSRDTFYRHKRLVEQGGIEALKRQETPNLRHKNHSDTEVEQRGISFSLENPHLGQQQVSLQLKANQTADVSPAGVRYIWLRENMNTMAMRVKKARKAEMA